MSYLHQLIASVVSLVLVLLLQRTFVRRARARSLIALPGPPSRSWLVGHLPDLLRPDEAAQWELAWTDRYGTAIRLKGAMGIDILFISDPKAMQYILHAGYNFPKPQQNTSTAKLFLGEGLTAAEGAQHVRQRKIMTPAFSYGSLKIFLPMFSEIAQKTTAKWKEEIGRSGHTSIVLDMSSWLSRTTLDALGETVLNYSFGAIDEAGDEFTNVYDGLFADVFFERSNFTIAFEALWGYLPLPIVHLMQSLPTKQLQRLNRYMKVSRRVAKRIVGTQTELLAAGKETGKDVMSIITRGNLSEDPKARLGEEEILSQLTTLMLAGHETTSLTLTWTLYELSRDPDFQAKVRQEIADTRAKAAQRGDGILSVSDLDSMEYMIALFKESMRFHPIDTLMHREAGREDVIPLSVPHTIQTGEVISSIPVRKGQRILLSIAAYNKLKSVWGEDANMWRPERFLESSASYQKTGVGMTGNIATFSSGIRSCIGWRFAMIEMQAILIELLEQFEFSPAPGDPEIIRGIATLVHPMIRGSPGHVQLPLTVTPINL